MLWESWSFTEVERELRGYMVSFESPLKYSTVYSTPELSRTAVDSFIMSVLFVSDGWLSLNSNHRMQEERSPVSMSRSSKPDSE